MIGLSVNTAIDTYRHHAVSSFPHTNGDPIMTRVVPPRSNCLKSLREQRQLTQKEVAKLLDIDFTTVSKHEAGSRGLTETEITAYSKLYKVESYALFIEPEVTQ